MKKWTIAVAALLATAMPVSYWLLQDAQSATSGATLEIRPAKGQLTPLAEIGADAGGITPEQMQQAEIDAKVKRRKEGYTRPRYSGPNNYAKIERERRTRDGEAQPGYGPNYTVTALRKAQAQQAAWKKAHRTKALDWKSRGPANVPGRTRSLLVMPDDLTGSTWLAGTAGGGIWKTTDKGRTWKDLTPTMPNLAVTSMAMAGDTIYAGTGEFIGGSIGVNGRGMLRSTDKGQTWSLLESTFNKLEFTNVNRIIVDPANPNVVVAATSQYNRNRVRTGADYVSRIMRSEDGGATWQEIKQVFGVIWQVIASPNNFNVQFATQDGVGVWRSEDAGKTWAAVNSGIISIDGRAEVSVSPVDPNIVFLSAEGSAMGSDNVMYYSNDAGKSWQIMSDPADSDVSWLGGQGNYDHTIVAHPYEANTVYVGGVNMWKVVATDKITTTNAFTAYTEDLDYVNFVNFGGDYLGGGMDVNDNVAEANRLQIEIRFGVKQKAHRFTVNKQGPGVPAAQYLYKDYVEVPFQVWDMAANRQLMVSFRDQQEDGAFNLINLNTDGDPALHSREYIYVQNVAYSDTANASIAVNGGQEFQWQYQFWPYLAAGNAWDPEKLNGKIVTTFEEQTSRDMNVINLTDAYGEYSGKNAYNPVNQGGIHPDHHWLVVRKVDAQAKTFQIIDTNDGGVHYSNEGTDPGATNGSWTFAGSGLISAQYHAVDKRPGQNMYIGGMQDNGTWRSPVGSDPSASTNYNFMIGGDGFDVVWNAKRGDWVMGSVYFNDLLVSKNAGLSWNDAVSGLNDKGSGKASFYSPLGNARSNPDWVYAAGTSGVWYSSDFGGNWKLAPITSEWAFGSLCQVKVSLAYNRIVWAGSRMSETGKLFVSTNGGKSFSATKNYETETMGAISGMATHPTEANTAYALFSFADAPKILRTKDLGQTWEDITGFEGGNDESNNGFPDVAVYDLLVMPHATNTIWAGTEIGIVESTDNGASWHLLDANLPAVAVVDMKVADQQVVIGTHGRGIWTVDIPELPAIPLLETPKIVFASVATGNKARVRFSISSGFDSVQFFLSNEYMGSSTNTGDVDAIFSNLTPEASYIVKGIAFHNGNQYPSEDVTLVNVVSKQGFDSYSNRFNANPGSDFSGVGFGVRTEAGFFNPAIHSEHVYRDGGEYTYELLKGITIAASNANFFYRDVAIVEPGEPGSVFGEPAFNDYVVLEASLDRINWFAVGDGYDADAYPEWQQAFADASAGTAQMFKDRNINLLDYFMPGEIVYFRFRMYANSSVAGWGWAIDDIFIQENAPLGFEEDMANELLALQAYPNPAIGQTNIAFYLPQASEVSLNLVDASGKQTTRTIRKGRMNAGRHELPLPLNGVPKGVYLLQLHAEGQQRIFRLLVQ